MTSIHFASDKFDKNEFKYIKGIIRIRKSKMDRRYNGEKKQDERATYDLQNIQIKLKIE